MKQKMERRIAGLLRISIVVLCILLQLLLIVGMIILMKQNAVYLYFLIEILSAFTIFALVSTNQDSSFTIAWVLLIMLLSVFGFFLYLIWGRSDTKGKVHDAVRDSVARGMQYLEMDENNSMELRKKIPHEKQVYGLLEQSGFPVYRHTHISYFPLGELQFDSMIEDMKKAEKFIFISYFILSTGRLWDRIYPVLVRRAQEGVEVRIMYDDFGSILTVPGQFIRELERKNIQAIRFSPVHRFISQLQVNYRNHQKIVVIDGSIGYTGGTNLADEYVNYYPKHGHWKDNAIRMEGEAVWSLTVNFLQMWDSQTAERSDYLKYKPAISRSRGSFLIPFFDGPMNNPHNPAELVYRAMIAGASEYIYITTPYLIIDNTMRDLLCAAASAGVDVRIITPHIEDHWYVHLVTQSNYGILLESGVRIFEYTPGFIHAKTIISDDIHGVVGSINMDYRSFKLHYENGVWIGDDPVIRQIRNDLVETFNKSQEIFLPAWRRRPLARRAGGAFLRLFAILM